MCSSLVQIEGKSFDLSADLSGDEPFIKIVEKGPRKSRWIAVSSAMARWMRDVLASPLARASRSATKKRFGRVLGWVKVRSNKKGRFVELGFSMRDKKAAIFIPGRRAGDSWAAFRGGLEKVLERRPTSQSLSGGASQRRSYRDAVAGPHGCSLCGRPWLPKTTPYGPGSHGSDSTPREETHDTTTQPAARDSDQSHRPPNSDRVRGESNGFEFSYNGGTIHITLDVGQILSAVIQSLQQALTQGITGVGQSILAQLQVASIASVPGTQTQSDPCGQASTLPTQVEPDVGVALRQTPVQEKEVLGLGDNACPLDAFVKYNPFQALDGVADPFGSENTSSFGDSSCELRDQADGDECDTHVSGTPSVDLQDITLFDEEVANTPVPASEPCLSKAVEDEAGPSGLSSHNKGDGILPTPALQLTLGNEEADMRGNELMKAMGIQLVDAMGKEIEIGTKTYSRRKFCRELENLKTSINYDGRGLRKGFLNKS